MTKNMSKPMSRFSIVGSGTDRLPPIRIDEEKVPVDQLIVAPHYKEYIHSILIPRGFVLDRIEKLAWDIAQFYGNEELHIISILKGSRALFTDLFRCLDKLGAYGHFQKRPAYFESYVQINTYSKTSSTGEFSLVASNLSHLKGKHVLIVEDIIDTGFTLRQFISWLQENVKPLDIAVASLLEKRKNVPDPFYADFVGFSIPDVFVVGFCLDFENYFRDLEHISVLDDAKFMKQMNLK